MYNLWVIACWIMTTMGRHGSAWAATDYHGPPRATMNQHGPRCAGHHGLPSGHYAPAWVPTDIVARSCFVFFVFRCASLFEVALSYTASLQSCSWTALLSPPQSALPHVMTAPAFFTAANASPVPATCNTSLQSCSCAALLSPP